MAALSSSLPPSSTHPQSNKSSLLSKTKASFTSPQPFSDRRIVFLRRNSHKLMEFSAESYRITTRGAFTDEDEDDDEEICSFDEAVSLFNKRDYYKCHDVLEALWNNSQEPTRTLLHGILQCAVGFHHLFNHNHKGAMMELGEGMCKLRKMNFENGPFHKFEREISAVLEFIYQTQLDKLPVPKKYALRWINRRSRTSFSEVMQPESVSTTWKSTGAGTLTSSSALKSIERELQRRLV